MLVLHHVCLVLVCELLCSLAKAVCAAIKAGGKVSEPNRSVHQSNSYCKGTKIKHQAFTYQHHTWQDQSSRFTVFLRSASRLSWPRSTIYCGVKLCQIIFAVKAILCSAGVFLQRRSAAPCSTKLSAQAMLYNLAERVTTETEHALRCTSCSDPHEDSIKQKS